MLKIKSLDDSFYGLPSGILVHIITFGILVQIITLWQRVDLHILVSSFLGYYCMCLVILKICCTCRY